jgi:hypothetical protein
MACIYHNCWVLREINYGVVMFWRFGYGVFYLTSLYYRYGVIVHIYVRRKHSPSQFFHDSPSPDWVRCRVKIFIRQKMMIINPLIIIRKPEIMEERNHHCCTSIHRQRKLLYVLLGVLCISTFRNLLFLYNTGIQKQYLIRQHQHQQPTANSTSASTVPEPSFGNLSTTKKLITTAITDEDMPLQSVVKTLPEIDSTVSNLSSSLIATNERQEQLQLNNITAYLARDNESRMGEMHQQQNEEKQNTTALNFTDNNQTGQQSSTNISMNIKEVDQMDDSPPRPHPHAGAKHHNGKWGYVANVTALRIWMINKYCENKTEDTCNTNAILPMSDDEMNKICYVKPDSGFERSEDYEVLAKRVIINNTPLRGSSLNNSKVLCGTYTHHGNYDRAIGIGVTWGWRCDGYFAASTKTITSTNITMMHISSNPPVEIIELPHEGPEKYGNMWQKTRSILAYMYDNYLEEFDYFYLAGDDTHVIVENLKLYLEQEQTRSIQKEHNDILYAGNIVKFAGKVFIGGGSGYVLSRTALKLLIEEVLPTCNADLQKAFEDRLIGVCLKEYLKIDPMGAIDNNKRQLFHGKSPKQMVNYLVDDPKMKASIKIWEEQNPTNFSTGIDYISPYSVAFHLLKGSLTMKRHHALAYKGEACPNNTSLYKTLMQRKF